MGIWGVKDPYTDCNKWKPQLTTERFDTVCRKRVPQRFLIYEAFLEVIKYDSRCEKRHKILRSYSDLQADCKTGRIQLFREIYTAVSRICPGKHRNCTFKISKHF